MRFDSIGMFWEDVQQTRSSIKIQRPMPEIPETGWRPPIEFPNLSQAVMIALDTETYDPELKKMGPGWARGSGHIVGISLAAVDSLGNKGKWYFPIRHESQTELNMDPEKVFAYLRDTLANPAQPKIGANLQYDVGWLRQEGVAVAGFLFDVQYAEALLNEAAPVALESLGQKYLGLGKDSEFLYLWLSDWFGGAPTPDQRKWIYKAPPSLVGPYAESDADIPLRLYQTMVDQLRKEDLLDLFSMECRLIRLTVDMRFAGVSVDVDKAEKLRDTLQVRFDGIIQNIKHKTGLSVNVNASASLAELFDHLGLPYPKTANGNPSFKGAFLDTVNHPMADLIREAKKCFKLRSTFIESYILDSHVNGKVYGQFHPLRGEGGGTRSGRYSSSTPNLQNIPSKDDELAPLIRGLFVPDDGHPYWRKYDYSQVEYRFLIHFAIGQAGEDIRRHFNLHPDTDYHIYAQKVVEQASGLFIERKPIKSINFGLIYGMGLAALAAGLQMSIKDAKKLMEAYFTGVPFAKPTMSAAMKEAQKLGVITTILGRKSRFDMYEPVRFDDSRPPLGYQKALMTYGGNIQRAGTHKALNRRLQGSSADLMKKAMLMCYEGGIFDETGIPRLTVHDELDFSDPGGKDSAFREMQYIMETAIPEISIPMKADGEIGPDWGHMQPLEK
jgi:DNA polymerase-1